MKEAAVAEFDKVIDLMKTYEQSLIQAEETIVSLLNISIEDVIKDVEVKANEYYQSFVDEYSDDIEEYKEFINSKKEELKK